MGQMFAATHTIAFFPALSETTSIVVSTLLAMAMLAPVALAWIKVIEWFKGPRDDLGKYATKAELAAVEARFKESVTNDIDALREDVAEMRRDMKSILSDLSSLNRSLGRVEGAQQDDEQPAATPRDKRRPRRHGR